MTLIGKDEKSSWLAERANQLVACFLEEPGKQKKEEAEKALGEFAEILDLKDVEQAIEVSLLQEQIAEVDLTGK